MQRSIARADRAIPPGETPPPAIHGVKSQAARDDADRIRTALLSVSDDSEGRVSQRYVLRH